MKRTTAQIHSVEGWRFLLILLALLAWNQGAVVLAAVPKQWISNSASFVAGGVGGGLSVLVGHPMDLVKVRMQTAIKDKESKAVGTFATLHQILKQDGIRGIYKGIAAPMLAVAPIWATSFWGFDTGDKLVRYFVGLPATTPLNLWQLAIAGGFSAIPTALVMVPSERIKCLMQTQQTRRPSHQPLRGGHTAPPADSLWACARHIVQTQGLIPGLYRGTALTLMRDIPGNMVYFGVYDWMHRKLLSSSCSPTTAALLAGAAAGMAFWPIVLPMDTLKSRYQSSSHYQHMGQVYQELMDQEGPEGFFRGIRPAMIRSAPANAVSFLGAEMTKTVLAKLYM